MPYVPLIKPYQAVLSRCFCRIEGVIDSPAYIHKLFALSQRRCSKAESNPLFIDKSLVCKPFSDGLGKPSLSFQADF